MTSLLHLLTQALATFRLTRLITEDTITQPIRDAIFARYGDPSASPDISLPTLVSCPHCSSIYAGAAVATLSALAAHPRVPAPLRQAATILTTLLALSGTISLLNDYGPTSGWSH